MKQHFTNMFAYESWANTRLLESLLVLDQIPQRGIEIMSHIISTQRLWYDRLIGVPQSVAAWADYVPGVWYQAHEDTAAALSAFIDSLSEESFRDTVTYQDSKGIEYQTPIHEVLTHLTHHAAYHRDQVVLLMKLVTSNLPKIDYIVYQREERSSS